MSKKINNYIILDFETGGLDCKKNPIIEFGCVVVSGKTYEQILQYDNIIRPYDEGLVYEEQAAKVHGISKEMALRDGITLKQFAQDFETICNEANTENSKIGRPMLVGHNIQFDKNFLCEALINRCKLDLSKLLSGSVDHCYNFQPDYIDTIQLCKNVVGHSNDTSIKFNLTECCRRFGIQVVDGHRAMNDVIPTKELFVHLMTRLRSSSSQMSLSEMGIDDHRLKFEI